MFEKRKYRAEPGISRTLKAAAQKLLQTKEMNPGHTGEEGQRASRHKADSCPLLVFSSSKGLKAVFSKWEMIHFFPPNNMF